MARNAARSVLPLALTLALGCGGTHRASTPEVGGAPPAESGEAPSSRPDLARGGRLYDNWRVEAGLAEIFVPSRGETPGRGGPNGDGTLNDGSGRLMANPGHDYRLKNFFGWDLRGQNGIYGPRHQNKASVLGTDLLADSRSADALAKWLGQGDEDVPAFGEVLDAADLADLAAFIVAVREGALPGPNDVFRLSVEATKHYELVDTAQVDAGHNYVAATCAKCHGDDGRAIRIND
jgi:hypothetical protein